ncbi:aldo-keto reductase, putative [Perkinsus marinus ATCC 50983]|uniref:Aldo-keto reductase, putative n=1 Tax=Perkinsus marinus (strain ATCC 50983 / TXsc) TaxID=423536 RepID=C5LML6_PERM5|nr:aldo-keto reductase, putative [Perkinsus marinus ATCC 50983]EER02033.1 aldo-keto reductase, putative [Perkinsus marinus ATCC 50983]|eukprot:XP_002769315.1 aldo-keto reductase, putative [Perkinsus marinus ATCC 50983]
MPLLGLGLGHNKNETEVEEMVLMFLELGGRHIDTAIVYENQGAVGRAVKKSGIPREEVFITSKIPPQRMGYDSTFKAILEIVEEIDLGYIDMILIHWPSLLETTLPCRKVRSIGVSNFGTRHLEELRPFASLWPPATNQFEVHPLLPENDLVSYCRANGIAVTAYGSLGGPQRAKEFTNSSVLRAIGERYNKTPAQLVVKVLLRWALQQQFAIIPMSRKRSRMIENLDVLDFTLSGDDYYSIDEFVISLGNYTRPYQQVVDLNDLM